MTSDNGDLSPTAPSPTSAEAIKAQAVEARVALTRDVHAKQQEIAALQKNLREEQEVLRRQMEEQARTLREMIAKQTADLEAQMRPLQEELAKMTEVLWTVNLYLGRDEEITLLRDGAPADAETPITIRQRVLSMAEESLVMMDEPSRYRGMDAEHIDAFLNWLISDDAHLNRVLPEPKGVVVLVPTWVRSDAENTFERASRDAANEQTYWLLRNGERVYLLAIADPQLQLGRRILPDRDEFTKVFKPVMTFGGEQRIEPGSAQWLRAEAQADATRRHFMRIMMILQGLVDRTVVWHPLRPSGVNLLHTDAQRDGKVVLYQDGDTSTQLGDGHEPFDMWQKRLNRLMRPGLRIIGNWASSGFCDLEERDWNGHRTGHHPRVFPPRAYDRPDDEVPHLLESRKDDGFVIRFERTEKIEKRNVPVEGRPGWVHPVGYVKPQRRASLLVKPTDGWVLPFDLATVADLTYYLESREARSKHFLSMVPVVKAALAAKQAEAEQEAPFRQLLTQLLVAEGADPEGTDVLVDDLVHWWKIKNTWGRALNGDQKHEQKAVTEIVSEYKQRRGRGDASAIVEAGKRFPGAIAVAANRQGKWFVYSPSTADENVFLDVTPMRKDGTFGPTKKWTSLPQRSVSLLNVAWAAPQWSTWQFSASPNHYLTGPEREQLLEQVRSAAQGTLLAITELFDPAVPSSRGLVAYSWGASALPGEQPLEVTQDPLRWDDELISRTSYEVYKTGSGKVHLEKVRGSAYVNRWSSDSSLGRVPWRSEVGNSPQLVWSDDVALDDVGAWRERSIAAHNESVAAAKAARAARDEVLDPIAEAIWKLIRADLEQQARVRFQEDFGTDAEDLWAHHLSTLDLRSPVPFSSVTTLLVINHEAGRAIVGERLSTLLEFAESRRFKTATGRWSSGDFSIQKLSPFGSMVVPSGAVPEPEHAEASVVEEPAPGGDTPSESGDGVQVEVDGVAYKLVFPDDSDKV